MAREVRGGHGARACLFAAGAMLCFCLSAFARDGILLRIRDASGFAGGEVTVDVTMEASKLPSAIGFWIEYDQSKLGFVDAKPGAVVTLAGKDVSWDFPEQGRMSFLIFGLNSTRIAQGKILSITFQLDSDLQPGQEFEIHGLNESATDPNANSIKTDMEDGEVKVLACFKPAKPTNFTATDGLFGDHVLLSWNAVFGAQSYVVYRSSTDNPASATVLAVTALPFYSDYSALGASALTSSGGGCGGTSQSVKYTEYYYWVRAKNICGQSELAGAEMGWRGKSGTAAKTVASVEALPSVPDETTSQFALHLSAEGAIAPGSVDAWVGGGVRRVTAVAWKPSATSDQSGWAIVSLDSPLSPEEPITLLVTAKLTDGQEAAAAHIFVCDAATDSVPLAVGAKSGGSVSVSELTTAAIPDFIESMGPRYRVYPEAPFGAPQRVTIPVPEGVEPNEVLPHLYVAGKGWYPGPLVEGWIVPGSIEVMESDGLYWVSFDANFGGVVQLGYATAQTAVAGAPNLAAAIPTLLAAMALGASAIRKRLRRR